eukprot:5873238-Amphidinium_carterae.1
MLKIEMLGRWRSNLVTHYAGQAPLRDLSRDLNQRKLSDHLKDVMQQVAVELSDVRSRMEQIEVYNKEWFENERESRERFEKNFTSVVDPKFVKNVASGVMHRATCSRLDPPSTWRTHCGW